MKQRLGIVLDLRRAAEDAAKREVGRLERERTALVAALDEQRQRLANAMAATVPLAMREQLAGFRQAMLVTINGATAALSAHDALIAAARDALASAHREVKAIEAIRTRDAHAEARRQLRREGRANDEHAARTRLEALA